MWEGNLGRMATGVCMPEPLLCSPETHNMGRRFQREGMYVYRWLIHVDVWQKPAQYCKAIILQLKINKF